MKKIITRIKKKMAGSNIALDAGEQRIASIMQIFDEKLGHNASFEQKKPVDAAGNPLPWFTYPAIEYLRQLDTRQASVLEWGIGNSTRFFAASCKDILSVEHNREWFDLIAATLPENANPVFVTEEEYDQYPLRKNMNFDLIIVDGIKRAACIDVALKVLKKDGLLIFDNSDRNPELCEIIRNSDFIQVDFHGLGPINPYSWTTSFFFSRSCNIKPLTVQPLIPAGGGF